MISLVFLSFFQVFELCESSPGAVGGKYAANKRQVGILALWASEREQKAERERERGRERKRTRKKEKERERKRDRERERERERNREDVSV